MSDSLAQFLAGLHRALEGQAFRRVPLDALLAVPLRASGAGGEVDAVLRVVSGDRDWAEVVRQLARLRTKAFAGLHMRRDKHDLEVVVVHAWSGEVTRSLVDEHIDWVHTVVSGLGGALAGFALDDKNTTVLDDALERLAEDDPARDVVGSVADVNRAAMPHATVFAVDAAGVDPALAAVFDQWPQQRSGEHPLVLGPRSVTSGTLLDGKAGVVHGHGGWVAVDLPALRKGLASPTGRGA